MTKTAKRNFGTYTLHKGIRYKEILKKRWVQKRQQDIPAFLAKLATPGHSELYFLKDEKLDDGKMREKLETICDAIIIAQATPSNFIVSDICKNDAKAAKQKLIQLLADKTPPMTKKNFDKFAGYLSKCDPKRKLIDKIFDASRMINDEDDQSKKLRM